MELLRRLAGGPLSAVADQYAFPSRDRRERLERLFPGGPLRRCKRGYVAIGADRGRGRLFGQHVGEHESVSFDDLAAMDGEGAGEDGGFVDESVKLAVFAAWVDTGGQSFEEWEIEIAAGEGLGQFGGIDAGDFGFHAGVDHVAGELRGGKSPEGKQRFDARAPELAFAIIADVLQEEVAEGHGGNRLGGGALPDVAHALLVLGVRARGREFHHPQREASQLGLGLDQRAADGMHGHAVGGGIEGRDERGDTNVRLLAEPVQRPGAVLAAAPG